MHYSLLFAFFLFTAFSAQADIPPPDDECIVDDCTVAIHEQEGTTCDVCGAGPGSSPTGEEWDSGLDPNHCDNKFQGTNYEKVCQTWGASFWTEVWCDGPPAENYPEPSDDCNSDDDDGDDGDEAGTSESSPFGCSSIDSVASGSFFFLLGGILYARRRRSRTNT